MMLWYFADEAYMLEILRLLAQIGSEDYYVKMALAWVISICYVNQSESTLPILMDGGLDDFTRNKALQKICESRRPSIEEKARLRALRCT
jgi:3-methyladenine DNA glycosylase AlkD